MQYNRIAAIAGVLALAFILSFSGLANKAFAASAFTANPQSVTTTYNTAINITLTGTGPSPHYYVIDSQPANGVLSNLNNATGFVTYTPNSGYVGADSFTFYKTDGLGDNSDPATVDITVRPQPVTADLAYTTPYFTAVNVQLVVVNGATFQITQAPAHGQIQALDANAGTLTYQPDVNFSGSDSFKFVTTDGVNTSNESTVTFTVEQAVGRGGYFAVVNMMAKNLAAQFDGGASAIPDDGGVLYDLHVLNGVLFTSMDATDAAFGSGSWNHLTEGQQVWIVLHFNELVSGGTN